MITFFEVKEWEEKEFREGTKDLGKEVILEKAPLNEDNAERYRDSEGVVVFVNSTVSERVLSCMPKLRFVITRSTGMDHIDLNACQKRGIKVANLPTYASISVAEHAFALILNITRRIRVSVDKVSRFKFDPYGLQGIELFGKVLGVIGTGNIGKHICRIGYGFGMKVIAYDTKPSKELEELYQVEYVSLEELLRSANIIVIAVPYTPQTHHLINQENVELLRGDSMLVNVARGPIVDTNAIIKALQMEKLKWGVALDVFEGEKILLTKEAIKSASEDQLKRLILTLKLWERPDFILTPHIAYLTEDSVKRMVKDTVELIKRMSIS